MTTYMVLRRHDDTGSAQATYTVQASRMEANNAEQACRKVADDMSDDELAEPNGTTLIAVPSRNWTSGRNTFKAETRRRLLRS